MRAIPKAVLLETRTLSPGARRALLVLLRELRKRPELGTSATWALAVRVAIERWALDGPWELDKRRGE